MWDRLTDPLKWRKPAMIFAASMSDLFHEKLPMNEIATIFAVMVAAVHLRRHVFQVLTKRSDRMRHILNDPAFWDQANAEASAHVTEHIDPLNRRSDDARATLGEYGPDEPPPGIWLGVSVENQDYADERVPDLLKAPAAVRFLSCEPLLGPVDLLGIWGEWSCLHDGLDNGSAGGAAIDWVIVGGESGPRARDNDFLTNARALRDQCAAAGVPFFGKQNVRKLPLPDDLMVRQFPGSHEA
jgi:protein gp37